MDVLILDCGTDVAGESLLTDYKGKIELLSFSHGVAQQITGDQSNTKRTSGKPNHQDFTVTKYVDLASCKLIDFCNQAKPLASVTVTVGQNDNGVVIKYFTYVMTNAPDLLGFRGRWWRRQTPGDRNLQLHEDDVDLQPAEGRSWYQRQ